MNTQRVPAVPSAEGGAPPTIIVCSNDTERRARIRDLAGAVSPPDTRFIDTDCAALALDCLQEDGIDCLITDLDVPDMRTATLVERVSDLVAHLPVIVIADEIQDAEAEQLLHSGVSYLCVPPSTVSFQSAVRSALELQRLHALQDAASDQLRCLREELQAARELDPLTGAQNSPAFYRNIEAEFRRSARSAQPLSLLLADIDCFTAYNYANGQEAGDACLRRIGERLADIFQRAGDTVARLTGATFAVLLTNTDNEDVAEQAERLRQSVWDLAIMCNSSRVADRVTLSVGVATTNDDFDKGWEHLLQTAQNALTHAKAQGRNWVEVAASF